MKLIVRIPDEHAERINRADPERLQRAALAAVLQAADNDGRDQPALAGIASNLSPQEAAASMRAARPGNQLPPGESIRDLITHGRA